MSNADWGSAAADQAFLNSFSEPIGKLDSSNAHLPKPFTVCIMGASRGIGAGIAYSYAKAGASGIILSARRISGLKETAAECKKINSQIQIETVPCDITSALAVAALAEKAKTVFKGHLDVMIVNSGYSGPVVLKITDTDPETFQQAIDVNYVGTFHCAKYFIPLLLATKNGAKAFIAVSSMASLILRGPIANAQYAASKTAQLRLVEYVHEQYEEISAFSIHPGAVASEMALETAPKEFLEYLTDNPELCGAYCVWLTKDGNKRKWLSGRLISAKWDVDELEAREEEIVKKDLLKLRLTV